MKTVPPQKAFDTFKPESCVFVISVDENRRPNGMIAGWNMKCSISPPLFAVALSKKGNTHKLIQKSKEFVIAVPNKSLVNDVRFFGSTHGNKIDKFKESGIKTKKARFVKSPLLRDATINFECKLQKSVDSGDHIIFIGKILAAHLHPRKKVLMNIGAKKDRHTLKEF